MEYLSKEVSTLEFLSNIQPIDTSIPDDTRYMSYVHDPFALEQMAKMIENGRVKRVMTKIQGKEMQTASGHCAFAFKDDYPWGTVIIDGEKKVVCKCINRECSVFSQCRRGLSEFTEEELHTDQIGRKPDQNLKELFSKQVKIGNEFKKKLKGQISENVDTIEDPVIDELLVEDDKEREHNSYICENEKVEEEVVEGKDLSEDFSEWLKKDGFFARVIEEYVDCLKKIDKCLLVDGEESIFTVKSTEQLELICKRYDEKIGDTKYKTAVKYLKKYIETQYTDTEEVETDIQEEKKVSEEDSQVVLREFHDWMLANEFKKSTADGYVSNIKSANAFAKKKDIWEIDICLLMSEADILSQIELLESSRFFKSSMSNYILALRTFANYFSTLGDGSSEENSDNPEQNETHDSLEENVDFAGESFEKFTEVEQEVLINETASSRIIVNAGPGTGKTYSLIEKLINMVNDQEVDPEEILVLCFSRAAVDVIEKRLQTAYEEEKIGMNWHSIDIRTFDSFATHLLAYVVDNESELLDSGFSLDYLDYDGRIKAATDVIKKNNELIEQCSHLIVDEVQDLVGVRAKFVMEIVKGLPVDSGYTLLGDACQSIYDYQIQLGEIDSVKFYRWLFESQNHSKLYSLGINYRQVSELEKLGSEYRNAILLGDDKDRKQVTNSIFKRVEELRNVDLKNTVYEELVDVFGKKNVGILTRTNGQALKISTWFRNAGIPHRVQKRLTDHSLNVWIADIFRDYYNDTIDKETFVQMYSEKGDLRVDPEDIWSSLEKTQYEARDRYYVKDLLMGILNNGKTKEFYTVTDEEQITISNIHRAKGREFDDVVLLEDTLQMNDQDLKDIQENKVSYVAVTRAKEKIYRTSIGTQYIKTDKNGDRRAYVTGLGLEKRNHIYLI